MRRGTLILLTLCAAAVMGVAGPGARVEGQETRGQTWTGRTQSTVVGASVVHPGAWSVEREPYTLDGTYGYTLWRPESGRSHDHGGMPALRVALAYDLAPGQIAARVQERLSDYPDLPLQRQRIPVARRHEGFAVGPIPGSTPLTEVYVPVGGRVYRVDVYGESLDAAGRTLLSSLRFSPPSRPAGELALPAANSPEALYLPGREALVEREQSVRETAEGSETGEAAGFSAAGGGESRLREGCWRAAPGFFVQLQHGRYANSSRNDGIPTGYTILGRPNYWDEYTHGKLDFGRCKASYYTNDKFAIDYPLDRGDAVFSPFRRGTVTFAGRNLTHRDYGTLVAIRSSNGKYVSLSAHLDGLARGIKRGARVDTNTVIGFAGSSGGGRIPVGRVHLHQAFYRYPSFNPDGSPYGGRGLQVVRHNYVRKNGGVYTFGWRSRSKILAKGDRASN